MSQYLVLLYAPEGATEERREDMPLWLELTDSLREAGLLVANGALHSADVATTIQVRGGETQIIDGPYAVTKEILAGFYVLECDGLDEALRLAARFPTVKYGSVEIRPIADLCT